MRGFSILYQESEYRIPPGERVVLGRSDSCGIIIKHSSVSRRHAALHINDKGLVLEDLNSRNGTAVNGKRLAGPTQLWPGDVILAGHVILDVAEYEPTRQSLAPSTHQSGGGYVEEGETETMTVQAVKEAMESSSKVRLPDLGDSRDTRGKR